MIALVAAALGTGWRTVLMEVELELAVDVGEDAHESRVLNNIYGKYNTT